MPRDYRPRSFSAESAWPTARDGTPHIDDVLAMHRRLTTGPLFAQVARRRLSRRSIGPKRSPSVDDFGPRPAAFDAWTVADPLATSATIGWMSKPLVLPDLESVDDLLVGNRAVVVLVVPLEAHSMPGHFFEYVVLRTTVTLTSRTGGYPGYAIGGADIELNDNPQARLGPDEPPRPS